MPTYISLLRGINVGGHRKIRMADLTALYESLSLRNVNTYVQSGNVVFDSKMRSASKIAASIEEHLKARFGFDVTVLVRTPGELASIIEGNPFSAQAAKDPAKVSVMFLASRPTGAMFKSLDDTDTGSDEFFVGEREIYLHFPDGAARSKLNNTFFERKLKMPTTARNWRTVRAVYDMAVSS